MPGYLTQAKVLIDAVDWLTDLENVLEPRVQKRSGTPPKKGATPRPPDPIRDLEINVLLWAREARRLLRQPLWDSGVAAPESPAKIEPTDPQKQFGEHNTGVGGGISRYAFMGSLGHDFQSAGNILAINQRWVGNTMHWGSPAVPWVKAGSTSFLFNAWDKLAAQASKLNTGAKGSDTPVTRYLNGLKAALLGHCASIGSHVVLEPLLQNLVTADLDHLRLEAALDAQIAIGFFQREDIKSGDSWTDYYIDEQNDWLPVLDLYLLAFNATYDGPAPANTMCGLGTVDDLKKQFKSAASLVDSVPSLAKALDRYQGYDKLADGLTPIEAGLVKKELESDAQKDFKRYLDSFRCRVPKLDRDFLEDGWRNTRKWAIDEGYDKGPALFRWLWFFGILGGGFLVVRSVVSNLNDFSTILETITFGKVKHEDSDALKKENADAWEEDGVGNEKVLYSCLTGSYDGGSVGPLSLFVLFSTPLTGVPLIWDGIFGKGTAGFGDKSTGEKVFAISKIVYKVATIALGEIVPKVTESVIFRWLIKFPSDMFFDFYGNLVDGARDQAKGKEGDELSKQLWFLQMMLWPFNLASALLVAGVKSTQKDDQKKRETGLNFRDFALGQLFPLAAACLLVMGLKQFEKRIFGAVGVAWPNDDRSPIEPYLKSIDGGKPKKLEDGAKVRVRVFPDGTIQKQAGIKNVVTPDDASPEAYAKDGEGAHPFADAEYTLTQLFDRSKYLSGLLMLSAVRYDRGKPEERTAIRKTFTDWNLDYRAEREWKELMNTVDTDLGLLEATDRWVQDLQLKRDSPKPVINRLQKFFGLPTTTGGGKAGKKVTLRYEDGSPMPSAQFEAVFGDQRIRGVTDESGVAEIDAPDGGGDTFRLFLLSYPAEQKVEA